VYLGKNKKTYEIIRSKGLKDMATINLGYENNPLFANRLGGAEDEF